MLYLSGCVRPNLPPDVGVMLTPMMGNRLPEHGAWAADTGCYGAPHKHDDETYLQWLAKREPARCLFATAPDVVGDAAATLKRSESMLPRIRALGYPAALVAQDGLEALEVPWDTFDCLFMGGSTAWKLGDCAIRLMGEAKERGKWVHVGRVNSRRRYQWCHSHGADSADGTFVAFGPDVNIPRLQKWLTGDRQLPMVALSE